MHATIQSSIRLVAVSTIVLVVLAGCSGSRHSGFLGDYSDLEPDNRFDGALTYVDTEIPYGSYTQVVIEPVVLHIAPESDGISLDAEQLVELARYTDELMYAGLSRHYRIVTSRRAGAFVMRVAITDLKGYAPSWEATSRSTSGFGVAGAAMEAEAIDAVTGKRLSALVNNAPDDQQSHEGPTDLEDAKEMVRHWVGDLMTQFDEQRATAAAAVRASY
jgi:hypothetical protein